MSQLPLPKNWRRRLSSSSSQSAKLGARARPAEESSSEVAELLRRYHAEEDRFLGELESLSGGPASRASGASSFSLSPSLASSVGALFRGSAPAFRPSSAASSPQTDLLGSFCHLMNYVVHLRRENRQLRKQMACLTEMREIEAIRAELVQASCTCCPELRAKSSEEADPSDPQLSPTVATPRRAAHPSPKPPKSPLGAAAAAQTPKAALSLMERRWSGARGESSSNRLQLPTCGSTSSRSPSFLGSPTSPSLVVREGAADSLATPPPGRDAMTLSSYSADLSSAADTSANRFGFPSPLSRPRGPPPVNPVRRAKALPPPRSPAAWDSDEQPVFSEVSLPNDTAASRRSVRSSRPPAPASPMQTRGAQENPIRGLLHNLGLKKRELGKTLSSGTNAKGLSDSMTQSLCSEPSTSAYSERIEGMDYLHPDWAQRGSLMGSKETLSGMVRKAFIKKRKRKISESDSLASSETSGHPYKIIDLPSEGSTNEIQDTSRMSSVDVEALRRNLNPTDARKLREWERSLNIAGKATVPTNMVGGPSLSGKGAAVRAGWRKQSRVESGSRRYFEQSLDAPRLARQDTVIRNEPRADVASPMPDGGGIGTSLFSASEDSVFMAASAVEGGVSAPAEERAAEEAALVSALESASARNEELLSQLAEKGRECADVEGRLGSLEAELGVLKGRLCLESELRKAAPSFVPAALVEDVEQRLDGLGAELRRAQGEAFRLAQESLEVQARDQANGHKYLDHVEQLQKSNFALLQRSMAEMSIYDPEIRRQVELMPTYDSLYSFTLNIIRKLRQLRCELRTAAGGVARMDLELLHTQASLLLAHAQIERQKIQMRCPQRLMFGLVRLEDGIRRHSFHGLDVKEREVCSQLDCYLPFKIHASKAPPAGNGESGQSHAQRTSFDEQTLEQEFLRLFDCARQLSGAHSDTALFSSPPSPHYRTPRGSAAFARLTASPQAPPRLPAIPQGRLCTELRSPTPQRRPLSMREEGPTSPTPVRRRIPRPLGQSGNRREPPPSYVQHAPAPLKLGNFGQCQQVRTLAASFDPKAANSSAPNTPLSKCAPQLLQGGGQTTSVSIPNSPIPRRIYTITPIPVLPSYNEVMLGNHYDTPASSSSGGTRSGTLNSRKAEYVKGLPLTGNWASSRLLSPSSLASPASPASSRKSGSHLYETLTLPGSVGSPKVVVGGGRNPSAVMGDSSSSGASSSNVPIYQNASRVAEQRRRRFLFGSTAEATSSPLPARFVQPNQKSTRPGTPQALCQSQLRPNANPNSKTGKEDKSGKRNSWILNKLMPHKK